MTVFAAGAVSQHTGHSIAKQKKSALASRGRLLCPAGVLRVLCNADSVLRVLCVLRVLYVLRVLCVLRVLRTRGHKSAFCTFFPLFAMNFYDFAADFSAGFAPPAPSRKRKRDDDAEADLAFDLEAGLGFPWRRFARVRRTARGDEPPAKRRKSPPEPEPECVSRPRPRRSKRVHSFYFHFGRLVADVVLVPRPRFFLRLV